MRRGAGKFLMAAAAAFLLAWPFTAAAETAGATEGIAGNGSTAAEGQPDLFKLQGILRKGKQVVQNALYLDKNSIHVIDVDDIYVTVTAEILETANEKDFRARSVLFRLDSEGKQSIFGADADWHDMPDATDEPVAVAGREIWLEIGETGRREQFLQEIQEILVKKAEAAAGKENLGKAENPAAEASAPAAAGNSAAKDAPVEIFVEVPPEMPEEEMDSAKKGKPEKREPESVKEKEKIKTAKAAEAPESGTRVVVEIETRE